MFFLILALSIALVVLYAYTSAMQKTTLALGRLLVDIQPTSSGTGVQDAITPTAQNNRNILVFALFPLVFGLTAYSYAWYHGIWLVIACYVGSLVSRTVLGPRPGSPRLVASIARF